VIRLSSGRNGRGSAEYEQVRSRVTKSGHSAAHQVDTLGSISGGVIAVSLLLLRLSVTSILVIRCMLFVGVLFVYLCFVSVELFSRSTNNRQPLHFFTKAMVRPRTRADHGHSRGN